MGHNHFAKIPEVLSCVVALVTLNLKSFITYNDLMNSFQMHHLASLQVRNHALVYIVVFTCTKIRWVSLWVVSYSLFAMRFSELTILIFAGMRRIC
jgi:hypothetical protein